jgi:hypothetical protein
MITQLKSIVGFREEEIASTPMPTAAEHGGCLRENSTEVMKTRIEDLELSSRTISALEKANIRTVGGLARKREEDLIEIEGLGPSRSRRSSEHSPTSVSSLIILRSIMRETSQQKQKIRSQKRAAHCAPQESCALACFARQNHDH